jgi:hypothetical protein
VLFSFWFSERSPSSVFSRLPASPLILVNRSGCGLSFRVFCAESFTLLLISLVDVCVIIFHLMAFFVVYSGFRFLVFGFIIDVTYFFIYFILFILFLFIAIVSLLYFPHFVTFSFPFSE